MSRDARIDAYIAGAQPFARPVLETVRRRVHAVLPDVDEAIKWSMPAYVLGGKIIVMTAAFKAHAAVNFWRGQELGRQLGSAGAMGQFGRIKSVGDLPCDTELDRLIRKAAELSKDALAPRKTKHRPRPALEPDPAFAAALAKAPEAKAMLDSLPPSAKRDYFEWISQAKQDSTRDKRIATAVEWLSQGKRRHWKYQNC